MDRLTSILLTFVAVGTVACADPVQWTAEELANASHFFAAAEADIAATEVLNSAGAAGTLSEGDRLQIIAHKRQALQHARAIRDDVLEKAMPGLSGPFREKFERSLELQWS